MQDIITKYTKEGKTNIADLVRELHERVTALEEAMAFFSTWYNNTQTNKVNILVPEHLANTTNTTKIIM